jgi:hypothetical protein
MPWIIVHYRPGFSANLTSWETCIEEDGSLSQIVRIARFSPPIEQRTDRLNAHLSSEQLTKLRDLIAVTDFSAISAASRTFSITDASCCSVTVHQADAVLHFEAPLRVWLSLQEEGLVPQFDLSPALRLWDALDAVSPYGIHSSVT